MNFVLTLTLLVSSTALAAAGALDDDRTQVERVVRDAYVQAVFIDRDEDAVRAGFHPDFIMHVKANGQLIQATLDAWLERLELEGTPNPKTIHYDFLTVDISGDTAYVKLEVYEDGRKLYTDLIGLYRFDDGFKIVNKIFESHE